MMERKVNCLALISLTYRTYHIFNAFYHSAVTRMLATRNMQGIT